MRFRLVVERFPGEDGPLRFASIPWDSETFGFPFFELFCREIEPTQLVAVLPPWLESLRSRRPFLVVAKIPVASAALARVLCANGFYPVETMLEATRALRGFEPIVDRRPGRFQLRPATRADLSEISRIASGAFSTDRLHVDPNLDPLRADERYDKWVLNGFEDGERVLVYEDSSPGPLLGFYHLREVEPGTVDLSLAAVAPRLVGTGIGALMYQDVLLDCRARGGERAVTRITVHNVEVLNLFARLGFTFQAPVNTFHRFETATD